MRFNLRLLLPTVSLLLLATASLYSLPRLAAEHAVACKACHINPNGDGARTEFGNHAVAFQELCLPQTKKLVEKKFNKPRLSESVLIGFDTRHLIFDNGRVIRMQTDAYVTFEPFKELYYHFNFGESGIKENYALLYFDHQKYYIKAGHFSPAYGLRMADHALITSFVRDRLGFGSNVYRNGLSLGAEIKGVNLVGEILKHNEQSVGGVHIFRPGFIAPIGYLAGLSLRFSEKINGSTGLHPNTKGVFGAVAYDRFTLMGEIDLAGASNDTVAVYGSLNTRLEYGLYLEAEYNYFEPNRHIKSGVDEFVRISLDIYPLPYVEIKPGYTYYTKGARKDEDDFFVLFHVGY